MSQWGQVDEIYWTWASSETRCFSRLVVSKWNVLAQSIMKMMVPHDCLAILEKKKHCH